MLGTTSHSSGIGTGSQLRVRAREGGLQGRADRFLLYVAVFLLPLQGTLEDITGLPMVSAFYMFLASYAILLHTAALARLFRWRGTVWFGMFLAAAVAGHAGVIVSGDKHLLQLSGWRAIDVLKARQFVDRYIEPAGI